MRPRPWLDDTGGWPAAKGRQVARAEVYAGHGAGGGSGGPVPGGPDRARRRGGRPGRDRRAAADARAGPAVPDRLRRHADRAADLPGGAGRRAGVPGRAAARAAVGAGLARRAAWAWRSWAGTRPTIRTAWSRTGSAGRSRSGWRTRCGPTMVLRFRDALPGARQGVASAALRGLRIRKTPAEVAALREAGAAIDRVHGRFRAGSGPAGPSARSPPTSPPRSSPRGMPGPTS